MHLPHGTPGLWRLATVARCVQAALGGLLVALLLVGAPLLRREVTGLDDLRPWEWTICLLPAGIGFCLGRRGNGTRQGLFVSTVLVATSVATAALASALGLLRPLDPVWCGALGLAGGVALGALAGSSAPGRWIAPIAGGVGASAGVLAIEAALRVGWLPAAELRAPAAMLVPVLLLFAARPGRGTLPRPGFGGRLTRIAGVLVGGALLAWAAPSAVGPSVPPEAAAVFAAGAAGWLLAGSSTVWRLAFAGLGACASLLLAPPEGPDPGRCTILERNGGAMAVYDRATQELQLWQDGELVAGEGPDRPHAAFAATVLRVLLRRSDRVLVLGDGVGRLPEALRRAGFEPFDVASWRTRARPLLPRLRLAGPVRDPRAPARRSVGPPRGPFDALGRLPDASRQAIVVAEPIASTGDRWATETAQRELRRVAGRGPVLQPFDVDRTAPRALAARLAAARSAHRWTGVFVVGKCGLLVGADHEPDFGARSFAGWSAEARWQAHEAHLGAPADLAGARLGQGPESPSVAADSLLAWWRARTARIERADRRLLGEPAPSLDEARALVTSLLPQGAPSAALQAALGLPGPDGTRLAAPEHQVLVAHAIDPTFALASTPLFSELPRPRRSRGELEDLARLPARERLVELCAEPSALGVALRVRFPSACARALVSALGDGPLPPGPRDTLRMLADPFVLKEAGDVLAARSALPELLALWRGDLPMPTALRALLAGSRDHRVLLAASLAGRRDAASFDALADLLLDPDAEVRRIAGESLATTKAATIPFDADWPRSRRFLAAERVRAVHNRRP